MVDSLLFLLGGAAALPMFSGLERLLGTWLTFSRVALLLTFYFGLWMVFSVPLQKETRLSNWMPDSLLVVGNTASGRFAPAWKGEVFQLEFWDHALSQEFAEGITSGAPVGLTPFAAYDLSGSPPFHDQRHLLPDISWARTAAATSVPAPEIILDGKSWLDTRGPVSALVTDLQMTRQFALRVRCEPAEVAVARSSIVSVSQVSGASNLELQQEGTDLVFWFRNRISVGRSALDWNIPNVFEANQPRDILFSYDGANLALYVNGNAERRTYSLGPSTALAKVIRRVRPSELEGYRYVFYALMFFPAGIFLEFARRREAARQAPRRALLFLAILAPCALVEITFVYVSGRAMSLGNIVLSILLMLAGGLWLNADGTQVTSLAPGGQDDRR